MPLAPKYRPHDQVLTPSGPQYAYPEAHAEAMKPKPHATIPGTNLGIHDIPVMGMGTRLGTLASVVNTAQRISEAISGSKAAKPPPKPPPKPPASPPPITSDDGHKSNPSAFDPTHISSSNVTPPPPPAAKPFDARAGEALSKAQVDALANEVAYMPVRPSQIGQYHLDNDLSTKRHVVYVRQTRRGPRVVVGFRGTVPSEAADLYADLHITAGTLALTSRARQARSAYQKALRKYAGRRSRAVDRTRVTGHSLGGALAYEVSKSQKAHGTSFNMGAAPNANTLTNAMACQLPKAIRPAVCDRFQQFRMKKDPLSVSGTGLSRAGKTFGGATLASAHGIANFTNNPSVWNGLRTY